MRPSLPLLASLAALCLPACTRDYGGLPLPKDSEDTGWTDSTPDSEPDTADTDGDLDDDGWTPEEGDCDDDNVRVNPGRDEVVGDRFDNDCDGRVDEEFHGVAVAWDNSAGASAIVTVDLFGDVESELELSPDCYPLWIAPLPGGRWVINNGQAAVALVEADGTCTDIADFSETDFGVWGIATDAAGTIYATTVDKLYRIGEDGSLTELAAWAVDFEDPAAHEAAITGLAVDAATGEVGMFDYFGGFATWSEAGGLDLRLKGDWEAPALVGFAGAAQDGGRYYYLAGDTGTGEYGIYGFNPDTDAWELRDGWTDLGYSPNLMAIDSGTGDAYITANGGWYATIWRVVAGTGYAADLYSTDGTTEGRPYFGIVALYDEAG